MLEDPSSRNNDGASWLDIKNHFTYLVNNILQPFICAFGILGNLMIIIVLTRHRVRRAVVGQEKVVHVGFMVMAISDMLFCVSALPRAFVHEQTLILQGGTFTFYYQLYSTGLIAMFCLTSTWLVVVTAGIRYVGICHPLRARYLVSSSGIYLTISCVTVLCVLGNLPSFWLVQADALAPGLYLMDLGPFSHVHTRGMIYLCLRATLGMFVPGVLLIYFNVRLMMALKDSNRLHSNSVRRAAPAKRSKAQKRNSSSSVTMSTKHRLTRLLVVVIIMYVVFVYPCEMLDFGALFKEPETSRGKEILILARVIANLLQIGNFSFNFLLYCAMNCAFRQSLKDCWCLCQNKWYRRQSTWRMTSVKISTRGDLYNGSGSQYSRTTRISYNKYRSAAQDTLV